jgi:iron complex outermembrane recepter protein
MSLKKLFFIAVALCSGTPDLFGQQDSMNTVNLNAVYITEKKPSFSTTSRDIVAITNTEMKEAGAQTLPDAIATLPGVSQLTTGAISKPVIRGVYGNRIQVNVAGIRLEDQEWEDEHGLGISDIGIDRVELIKGPASLMFGSGALGGVINIIEEGIPDPGITRQNINLKLFSNTYGIGLDYGYKKTGTNSFLLRAGAENHADYSDGSGSRVPNTRFALYNLNLGVILNKKNWKSDNRLMTSYNQFGFISDTSDIEETINDPRLSRKFDEAHHTVLFGMLSSVNSVSLNETTLLNVTLGAQNNLRQEQERGNHVDLNLLLNTFTLNSSVEKQFKNDWTWTNGLSGLYQINTNLGSRIIVPDANAVDGAVFSYLKKQQQWGRVTGNFEMGMRYDYRQIQTLETKNFNTESSAIPPFTKDWGIANGSVGESVIIRNLVLKLNLASGFRSGNLAELSANGLHEGTPNWYIGDPNLKIEKCLNADFSASWQYRLLTLNGSVFRNRFHNFIYLQPTDEEYFGYSVFRYEQTDAVLQGFESGASIGNEKGFNVAVNYSFLSSKRDDGRWLPMMPANRLLFNTKYYFQEKNSDWQNPYLLFGINYCQEQNHVDDFEDPSPSYLLLNAGAGVSYRSFRFILTCRNLTNRLYYDHLSRLKYYGLYDMGREFVLNAGLQF